MARLIVLIDFTEQGVRNFRDTRKRAEAFTERTRGLGVTVHEVYWTVGDHDGVLILDAPDEETATAALLSLSAEGNVRTHTLRAFGGDEIESILNKAP